MEGFFLISPVERQGVLDPSEGCGVASVDLGSEDVEELSLPFAVVLDLVVLFGDFDLEFLEDFVSVDSIEYCEVGVDDDPLEEAVVLDAFLEGFVFSFGELSPQGRILWVYL